MSPTASARLRQALEAAGLGLWSCTDHPAPCLLRVEESGCLVRLSPVGFNPTGQPSPVWLTADRAVAVITDFAPLIDLDNAYADEADALVLWALLVDAAGRDAHRPSGLPCPCHGCEHERGRVGASGVGR